MRDHPRSRGVYRPLDALQCLHRGSSPLARGLLLRPGGRARAHRIIPARAGFTPSTSGVTAPGPDHPRSRGVYSTSNWSVPSTGGSSPLARGLLLRPGGRARAHRIIPARAGFTASMRPCSRLRRDHPRSRGVYGMSGMRAASSSGSSPLARGLPGGGVRTRGVRPDHPRSRGVYLDGGDIYATGVGSSPLARGLRAVAVDLDAGRRIIPARAGFTRNALFILNPQGDHPRSRGVYYHWAMPTVIGSGSSPLARGLRCFYGQRRLWFRIIPARAGFTSR